MHLSTILPSDASRHAALVHGSRWLALDSDQTGQVDTDSLTRHGELHHLFEGAVVVSEWDGEEPTFDDIELDD